MALECTRLDTQRAGFDPTRAVSEPLGSCRVLTMSVPAARYPSGLPIGIQLVAPPGGESQLVALAAQLESLNPWPRVAPQPPTGERDEPDQ